MACLISGDRQRTPYVESIRSHMDQEMIKRLDQNDDLLQTFLKEDEPFRNRVCSVFHANKTDRTYFLEEPSDKVSGVRVLNSTSGTVDGICNSCTCTRTRLFVSGQRYRRDQAANEKL
jgi:hypothetical protein